MLDLSWLQESSLILSSNGPRGIYPQFLSNDGFEKNWKSHNHRNVYAVTYFLELNALFLRPSMLCFTLLLSKWIAFTWILKATGTEF